MKIKKIQLKDGYKRFHHLTIDLGEAPARIIGLVGPNGCGKSSVLDGIMLRMGTVGNKGGRDHTYHSMHGTSYQAKQSIVIEFDCGSFSEVTTKRTGESRRTMYSFRSSYRYNSQVKITAVQATSPIAQNGYGASVAVDLDEKMEENYRRLHAKYNHYRDSTDSRPSEAKAKIIGDLNASLTRCLDLEIESLGNIEANQGTLYFKKADHPKPFEFNVLSSGEKGGRRHPARPLPAPGRLRRHHLHDRRARATHQHRHPAEAADGDQSADRTQLPAVDHHAQRRVPAHVAGGPYGPVSDHTLRARATLRG